MRDTQTSLLDIMDAAAKRRDERRRFMKLAGGATVMVGGLSALAACGDDDDDTSTSPTPTPTPSATATTGVSEVDVLNFALNLEYLEAQYYSYAAFGVGIESGLLSGTGTAGAVSTSGSGRPRQVAFSDPIIAQYAREIALDEIAHVRFLRSALGGSAVAQPAINISGGSGGAFAAAATASGIPGGSAFDPYADENSFLLGAFIFEDVGVTAYMGAVPLLSTPGVIESAAGIHAVEAYHAGLVRTILYRRGATVADLRTNVQRISDGRDTLDGTANSGLLNQGGDRDQGLTGNTTNATTGSTPNTTSTASNIVPTDPNGIAYARSPGQVLNIVYLTPGTSASSGGFFPNGVNGTVRTTA